MIQELLNILANMWPYLAVALWFLIAVLALVLQRFLASPAWTLFSFAALLKMTKAFLLMSPSWEMGSMDFLTLAALISLVSALCFSLALVMLLANYAVIRHRLINKRHLEGF
ncbi:MAG: hypothetical protein R2880_03595 [Deinococcales bacterium]